MKHLFKLMILILSFSIISCSKPDEDIIPPSSNQVQPESITKNETKAGSFDVAPIHWTGNRYVLEKTFNNYNGLPIYIDIDVLGHKFQPVSVWIDTWNDFGDQMEPIEVYIKTNTPGYQVNIPYEHITKVQLQITSKQVQYAYNVYQ